MNFPQFFHRVRRYWLIVGQVREEGEGLVPMICLIEDKVGGGRGVRRVDVTVTTADANTGGGIRDGDSGVVGGRDGKGLDGHGGRVGRGVQRDGRGRDRGYRRGRGRETG